MSSVWTLNIRSHQLNASWKRFGNNCILPFMCVLQSVTAFSFAIRVVSKSPPGHVLPLDSHLGHGPGQLSQAKKSKAPIWINWERARTFNGKLGIQSVSTESPVESDYKNALKVGWPCPKIRVKMAFSHRLYNFFYDSIQSASATTTLADIFLGSAATICFWSGGSGFVSYSQSVSFL